jgi:hypothetical protein
MSSCKKARRAAEKNADKWSNNLPLTARKSHGRGDIPLVDKSFEKFVRLPLKRDVVGRFMFLNETMIGRRTRMNKICDELLQLWSTFSFPSLSSQVVMDKIQRLLKQHVNNRKRKNPTFKNELMSIFDITQRRGLWLCRQDKELYSRQLASGGKVGYRTEKAAPCSSIHPSKLHLLKANDGEGCSGFPALPNDGSESVLTTSSSDAENADDTNTAEGCSTASSPSQTSEKSQVSIVKGFFVCFLSFTTV